MVRNDVSPPFTTETKEHRDSTEKTVRRKTMKPSRRDFLSVAGKGLGLAALSVPTIGALLKEVEAATRNVAHLTPEQVAMDEDYWSVIQNSFTNIICFFLECKCFHRKFTVHSCKS